MIRGGFQSQLEASISHAVSTLRAEIPSTCGDGAITRDEECDDGNAIAENCSYGERSCTVCGSGCTNVSGITSFCGDGRVDAEAGEHCDLGMVTGSDCVTTCAPTSSPSSTPSTTAPSTLQPTSTPTATRYVGTIRMPLQDTIGGYSTYWTNALRTTTRVRLRAPCHNPTIAIHQCACGDSTIQGSYYIMASNGSFVGEPSPFATHDVASDPTGQRWAGPTQMDNVVLQPSVYYHLAFQNEEGAGDMSNPSIYLDRNSRTVGIATFDDPRMDDPPGDSRGLPTDAGAWQNRWMIECH
jgi:hypothetical protein